MKKRIISFILIITLLFSFSVTSFANDNDEIVRTVNYINDIRDSLDTVVDMPSLESNDKLNYLALYHNKYMYYNDTFSSIQESGNLYYRGRYPWDRASYFLYEKQFVKEYISNSNSTYTEGIFNFINNPYSRVDFLDPLYEDIGMSTFEGLYTYELGGEERDYDYRVVYPYDNQINVPVNWENTYSIDPYENLSVSSDECGVPITYSFYSDDYKIDSIEDMSVTLTNVTTEEAMDIDILTPENDRYLTNSVIILPLEQYDYSTTYELNIEMDVYMTNYRLIVIDESISFKTEDEDKFMTNSDSFLTRADFTEEIIKASNYDILESFEIKFHDVDSKSVTANYIYTADVNGIVNGISDTLFGPDLNITKEQAYTMLLRAYINKYGDVTYYDSSPISDYSSVSSWARESICKAYALGLLITDDDNLLYPQEYLTENEFDVIIEKYNEIIDNM